MSVARFSITNQSPKRGGSLSGPLLYIFCYLMFCCVIHGLCWWTSGLTYTWCIIYILCIYLYIIIYVCVSTIPAHSSAGSGGGSKHPQVDAQTRTGGIIVDRWSSPYLSIMSMWPSPDKWLFHVPCCLVEVSHLHKRSAIRGFQSPRDPRVVGSV